MRYRNLHTHTTYCDGKSTVEEVVASALAKNLHTLGFSGHSYLFFDDVTMTPENTKKYIADVNAAREKYKEQIDIYLGVEYDMHGDDPQFARDFTIGSVHYIKIGEEYMCVDFSAEHFEESAAKYFGGDYYRMAKAYFEEVAKLKDITNCDIFGHIDLYTKFNEGGRFFDETDARYIKPALETIEHLSKQGGIFEINTGAMSRGYRTEPYPSMQLLRAIYDFGGVITISSDSHEASTIDAFFPEAIALAQHCGYRTYRTLTKTGWQDIPF